MGRKYKSKRKNYGHKDPYKQQAARFSLIKDKVDCPPPDDSQPIPRKLKKLFDVPKQSVDSKPEKVLFKGRYDTKGLDYVKNKEILGVKSSLPRLQQGKMEPEHQFMKRVRQMIETAKLEAGFKTKYNVDLEKDDEGTVVGWKKKEDIVPMRGKRVLSKKKIQDRVEKKRLRNRERMAKRNWKKRPNKNEDIDDEELESMMKHNMLKMDKVEFGEVVHAPPKLSTAHKLEQKRQDRGNTDTDRGFLFAENLPTTMKKKEVSNAPTIKKQLLERERLFAVNAYRELQKKRKFDLT